MPQKIGFQVELAEGANDYIGILQITNISLEDGGSVSAKEFLGVALLSPVTVESREFEVLTNPWIPVDTTTTNTKADTTTTIVTAQLKLESAHTFTTSDKITIIVNGDVRSNQAKYLESIVIAADEIPTIGINT
ncbi:hypothetical protein G7Z17_g6225 [Cylindrodendrum hubeiense]|uniref:Uncharacterized protein n=1 Tax=Cylindrodendrum hubeiense TaxID=595255 RepID=A0A9P5H7N1_9HYPO|nr:hypothetical protein G7Z17_g6225 [Cylindrodendrum hubeiense]